MFVNSIMATRRHSRTLIVQNFQLIILLSVISHFGIVGKSVCYYNQFVTEDLFGNKTCITCPSCKPGFGLTPQCGSTIKYGSYFKCEACEAGVTYSTTNDISSCKPCGICTDHMTQTSKCTPTQNAKCGTSCEVGFYYSDVTFDCQECSWCCKGSASPKKECQGKGIPFYKQCSADDGDFCKPRCSDKEFAVVDKTLNKTCIECQMCPIGTGLQPECSSVLTDQNQAKCTRCIPGKTFSNVKDSSTCKTCSTCEVGKKIERACNTTHDTMCGDCAHGFYNDKQPDGKVNCKACSFCCGDKVDVRVTECKAQGMPSNQQCAYSERAVGKCQTSQLKRSNNLVITLSIVFSLFAVAMVIVLFGICYYIKRRNRQYELLGKEEAESYDGELYPWNMIKPDKPSKDSRPDLIRFSHSNVKIICTGNDYVGMQILHRVSLQLCNDTSTYISLNLKEDEFILSPVFKFHIDSGPLEMINPVTLNLFHSAFVENDESKWSITVLKSNESDSSSLSSSEWTNLGDLKDIAIGKTWVEFLDNDLTSYVVIGTPGDKRLSKKRMSCVVFADKDPRIGSPFTTCLYLIDDCLPLFRSVIDKEEQLERRLVSGPHQIFPDIDPKSVISIDIEVSSEGWTVTDHPKTIHSKDWLASYKYTPKIEAKFEHQVEPFAKDFKCCFNVNLNNEKPLEIAICQYITSYCTQASDNKIPQMITNMKQTAGQLQDAIPSISVPVSTHHEDIKQALASAHVDHNPDKMEHIIHALIPQSKETDVELVQKSVDPLTTLSDMIQREQVSIEDLKAALKDLQGNHQPESPEGDQSASDIPSPYPECTNPIV